MNYLKPACILLVLGLTSFTARADILNIDTHADAFIRASAGSTPQGIGLLMLVGDATAADDDLRGVIAFDLSNPLLAGATINSVTLTLTIHSADTGTSANNIQTMEVHALTASFTEAAVTWTSRNGIDNWSAPGGDFGSTLATVNANPATATSGNQLIFNSGGLTSSVASSVGGNYYALLKLANESNADRSVFRIAALTSASPVSRLTIDYTPVPEPGTTVLALGLGGAGFIFRRRR